MADDLQQIIGFKIDGGEEAFRVLEAALAKYNARVEESTQHEVKFNKEGEAVLIKIKGMTSAFEKFTITLKGTKDGYEEMHTVVKTSKADLERLTGEWQKFFDTLERGFKKDTADHAKAMRQQIDDERARTRESEESARRIMSAREKLGKLMMAERGDISWKQLDPSARGAFLRAQTSQYSNAEVERQTQWLQMDLLARNHARIAEQNRRAAQNQAAAIDFNSLQFDTSGKDAALAKMQERIQQVALTWQSMLRMVQVHVFYRAISDLVSRMTEGVQAANTFLIKIGEIETISQRNALTTNQWADEIRRLSDAYGHDLLDTTNAVYEAISNQIASGRQVITFVQDAQRLAVIGVSSLMDATNALSSIINAYGLSASDATHISAVLFKTVDLGRVKLSEMANELGRLHAVSAQLGVTLEESSAAIATLTIQGIPYAAAQTYLSNVLLKLLRPTETMNKLFKEWGVTSGEAAIKTFGFIGVMDRLEKTAERNGDVLAEMGEQFGRIRAITGAAGLTGNMDKWVDALGQIKNSAFEANKAFDIMMENPGKKMEIEVNKVKNYFVNDWGRSILGTVGAVTNIFGGLSNTVQGTISIAAKLAVTYGLLKGVFTAHTLYVSLAEKAQRAYNYAQLAGQLGASRTAAAMESLGLSMKTLGSVVLPVAAFAFVTFAESLIFAQHNAKLAAEELGNNLQQQFDKTFRQFAVSDEQRKNFFEKNMNDSFQTFRQFTSAIRGANTKLVDALAYDYKETAKAIERNLGDTVKAFEDQVNATKRAAAEAVNEVARAQENIARRNQDMDERRFRAGIAGRPDREQNAAIYDRMALNLNRGTQALANAQTATERELAEKQIATAEKLFQELTSKSDSMLDQSRNKREQLEEQFRNSSQREQSVGRQTYQERLKQRQHEQQTQEKIARLQREINEARRNEVAAQEILNRLNRDREAITRGINNAEQAYSQRKQAEAQQAEARAEQQKAQLEEVRRAMRDFDALDIKKLGKEQYNQKLDEIQRIIGGTGLAPEKMMDLYREIDRQRSIMNRQFLTGQVDEFVTAIEKETARLEDELRKREQLYREHQGKLRDISKQELSGVGETLSLLRSKGVIALQSPIDSLQKQIAQASKTGNVTDLQATLNKIDEFRTMFDAWTKKLDETGLQYFNVNDVYASLRNASNNIKDQLEKTTAAERAVANTQTALNQLGAIYRDLSQTIKDVSGVTVENQRITLSAIENIQKKAKELKQVYFELGQAQARAMLPPQMPLPQVPPQMQVPRMQAPALDFGPTANYAFGGGTDRGLAYISPGEVILDRITSRTFAPVIRAMQSARYMNQGSNVTNVGDINVSLSGSGNSETDARHIASLIRREIRRGVIK